MRTSASILFPLAIMATLASLSSGCGSDPVEPRPAPPTILRVVVRSSADSSSIHDSNVVLYQAANREAVDRGMTDQDGIACFQCPSGNYFVNTSAQGYDAVPRENIAPLPFFVVPEDTTVQEVWLNAIDDSDSSGYILGHIVPAIDNFLVLAESTRDGSKFDTVSGPDGFFVIYNLPYGTYMIDALKSGFQMDSPVDASISSAADVDTVLIQVSDYVGSVLTGAVTFLASENAAVDITLLDPKTRSVIPGLAVMSDSVGLRYRITSIPNGSYLAWASLHNDGYVLDPDWLFKNPGGLEVAFDGADSLALSFSVTDVINLLSPTNPPDSLYAVMAERPVPTFRWEPYPSAKEYFIEVRDFSGNVVWGGFDAAGTSRHALIGADADSVVYNFDGEAEVPQLEPGKIYQWRVWADRGSHVDCLVEELISSSEDLRGIFQVPGSPID